MKKTKAQKRIFSAAESLSNEIYRLSNTLIHPEELTSWIQCNIKLTEEEQGEEFESVEDTLSKVAKKSNRKSTADELREAIGRPELSLMDTLHEAIHIVKEYKSLVRHKRGMADA